jgi:DNA-nicking Smr family endonuclease
MTLKVGDLVRFLDDEGEGRILSFPNPESALVEDSTGFAYEHPIKSLVAVTGRYNELERYNEVQPRISDLLERNIDKEAVKRADKDFKSLYKGRNPEQGSINKKGIMEVDLHIHELIDRHEGMTNAEIIQIQLEHFERMLRSAEQKYVQRVIFIHGVGQGVLRNEIRRILNQFYPHCEFLDAPYHTYGYGATEVRIHPQRGLGAR